MNETLSLINSDLFIRFCINIVSLIVLLRVVYYRNDAQSEAMSGFIIFGNGVFFVTALLHNVEMSMGFAFGLFAVFSMLRYRTETLSVRDMTYLFVLITISLLSSVSSLSMIELGAVNLVICAVTGIFETSFFTKTVQSKTVVYEKIELIKEQNKAQLYADLEERLSLKITDVEIGDVDFLRDTAVLKVYYLDPQKVKKSSSTKEAL
jgi:hypothetical protein